MKSSFDTALIGFITTFENVTGARVKDAYFDDLDKTLVFVVHEGDAGKAIGKRGFMIMKISRLLHKRVKVIEHCSDLVTFVKGVLSSADVSSYELKEKTLILHADERSAKARLIGRDKTRIKQLNSLVHRYFDVDVVIA